MTLLISGFVTVAAILFILFILLLPVILPVFAICALAYRLGQVDVPQWPERQP